MTEPFADTSISWLVQPYAPYCMEYATDMAWRAAQQHIEPALRLTKLAKTEMSAPGARLPLAAFRVPLDSVPAVGSCVVCKEAIGRKAAVTAAGAAFHKKCLDSDIPAELAGDLLLFAEELTEQRTIAAVLALRYPRR